MPLAARLEWLRRHIILPPDPNNVPIQCRPALGAGTDLNIVPIMLSARVSAGRFITSVIRPTTRQGLGGRLDCPAASHYTTPRP